MFVFSSNCVKLKDTENRLTRHELKVRKAAAVTLIFLGSLVAGILMFIAEMFESWLSNGQAALVDDLQAG